MDNGRESINEAEIAGETGGSQYEFKFSKLGLNKWSRVSLVFCLMAYLPINMIMPLYLAGIIIAENADAIILGSIFISVFIALPIASSALVVGTCGLLKPNPSFGRSLFVAMMPFFALIPGLNVILFVIVVYIFAGPTADEKRTAEALGIPLPEMGRPLLLSRKDN
ncbi:MAG: hypothetical protein E3J72_05285 [Planctomycetota bacterium]|nr:MAG: hypothetical protein E3J72_05285 [Planctomycetota bacterium]